MRNAEAKLIRQQRIQAAASIQWPDRTAILINPDPVVRKKLKQFCILVGAIAVAWATAPALVNQWLGTTANDQMKPAMEAAMQNGNTTAGTWLAMHYWKEYPDLLESQAQAGDPTAMFLAGILLLESKDVTDYLPLSQSLSSEHVREKGEIYIKRAADAGNLDALVYLLKYNTRNS
ncbi:hypothetical protein KOE80_04610 [Alcaligenes sp. 13f]|uniref:hypothetical protein n=1 Tax=Alcaligenes sp. 13f TaxID=2841924 RepID=UPI001CF62525|nr:hypothetical protein [Alcaligenes sp. 13f]MCB4321485.1 hypothetical protein [Alcaligenes sp. 13f]